MTLTKELLVALKNNLNGSDFTRQLELFFSESHALSPNEAEISQILEELIYILKVCIEKKWIRHAYQLANYASEIFTPVVLQNLHKTEIEDGADSDNSADQLDVNEVLTVTLELLQAEVANQQHEPDWEQQFKRDFEECLDMRWTEQYANSTWSLVLKTIRLITSRRIHESESKALEYDKLFSKNYALLEGNSFLSIELIFHNIELCIIWMQNSKEHLNAEGILNAGLYLGRALQYVSQTDLSESTTLSQLYKQLQYQRGKICIYKVEVLMRVNLFCELILNVDLAKLNLEKLEPFIENCLELSQLLHYFSLEFPLFAIVTSKITTEYLKVLKTTLCAPEFTLEQLLRVYDKTKNLHSIFINNDWKKWTIKLYQEILVSTRSVGEYDEIALQIRHNLNQLTRQALAESPIMLPDYKHILATHIESGRLLRKQQMPNHNVAEHYQQYSLAMTAFLNEIITDTVDCFKHPFIPPAPWALLSVGSMATSTLRRDSDIDPGAVLIKHERDRIVIPYVQAILKAVRNELLLLSGDWQWGIPGSFNFDTGAFKNVSGTSKNYHLVQTPVDLACWVIESKDCLKLTGWLEDSAFQRQAWALQRSTLVFSSAKILHENSALLFSQFQKQICAGLNIHSAQSPEIHSRSYRPFLRNGNEVFPENKQLAIKYARWIHDFINKQIGLFSSETNTLKVLYWQPIQLYVQWLGLYHGCTDPDADNALTANLFVLVEQLKVFYPQWMSVIQNIIEALLSKAQHIFTKTLTEEDSELRKNISFIIVPAILIIQSHMKPFVDISSQSPETKTSIIAELEENPWLSLLMNKENKTISDSLANAASIIYLFWWRAQTQGEEHFSNSKAERAVFSNLPTPTKDYILSVWENIHEFSTITDHIHMFFGVAKSAGQSGTANQKSVLSTNDWLKLIIKQLQNLHIQTEITESALKLFTDIHAENTSVNSPIAFQVRIEEPNYQNFRLSITNFTDHLGTPVNSEIVRGNRHSSDYRHFYLNVAPLYPYINLALYYLNQLFIGSGLLPAYVGKISYTENNQTVRQCMQVIPHPMMYTPEWALKTSLETISLQDILNGNSSNLNMQPIHPANFTTHLLRVLLMNPVESVSNYYLVPSIFPSLSTSVPNYDLWCVPNDRPVYPKYPVDDEDDLTHFLFCLDAMDAPQSIERSVLKDFLELKPTEKSMQWLSKLEDLQIDIDNLFNPDSANEGLSSNKSNVALLVEENIIEAVIIRCIALQYVVEKLLSTKDLQITGRMLFSEFHRIIQRRIVYKGDDMPDIPETDSAEYASRFLHHYTNAFNMSSVDNTVSTFVNASNRLENWKGNLLGDRGLITVASKMVRDFTENRIEKKKTLNQVYQTLDDGGYLISYIWEIIESYLFTPAKYNDSPLHQKKLERYCKLFLQSKSTNEKKTLLSTWLKNASGRQELKTFPVDFPINMALEIINLIVNTPFEITEKQNLLALWLEAFKKSLKINILPKDHAERILKKLVGVAWQELDLSALSLGVNDLNLLEIIEMAKDEKGPSIKRLILRSCKGIEKLIFETQLLNIEYLDASGCENLEDIKIKTSMSAYAKLDNCKEPLSLYKEWKCYLALTTWLYDGDSFRRLFNETPELKVETALRQIFNEINPEQSSNSFSQLIKRRWQKITIWSTSGGIAGGTVAAAAAGITAAITPLIAVTWPFWLAAGLGGLGFIGVGARIGAKAGAIVQEKEISTLKMLPPQPPLSKMFMDLLKEIASKPMSHVSVAGYDITDAELRLLLIICAATEFQPASLHLDISHNSQLTNIGYIHLIEFIGVSHYKKLSITSYYNADWEHEIAAKMVQVAKTTPAFIRFVAKNVQGISAGMPDAQAKELKLALANNKWHQKIALMSFAEWKGMFSKKMRALGIPETELQIDNAKSILEILDPLSEIDSSPRQVIRLMEKVREKVKDIKDEKTWEDAITLASILMPSYKVANYFNAELWGKISSCRLQRFWSCYIPIPTQPPAWFGLQELMLYAYNHPDKDWDLEFKQTIIERIVEPDFSFASKDLLSNGFIQNISLDLLHIINQDFVSNPSKAEKATDRLGAIVEVIFTCSPGLGFWIIENLTSLIINFKPPNDFNVHAKVLKKIAHTAGAYLAMMPQMEQKNIALEELEKITKEKQEQNHLFIVIDILEGFLLKTKEPIYKENILIILVNTARNNQNKEIVNYAIEARNNFYNISTGLRGRSISLGNISAATLPPAATLKKSLEI